MDIGEGLRELLVPELRDIKEEIKGLSLRMDQMEKRFEQMQKQMDDRFNLVFKEFFSIRELLGELNAKLDMSQRISRIEGIQEEMKRELDKLFEIKGVSIG